MAFSLGIGGMIYAGENEEEEFNPLAYGAGVAAASQGDRDQRAMPEHEKVAMEIELDEANKELCLPENDPDRIMEAVSLGREEDAREIVDEYVKAVEWQNTLLGSINTPFKIDKTQVKEFANSSFGDDSVAYFEKQFMEVPDLDIKIGLYKKDFAGLSLTAADALSDVLLYKNLTKKRIEIVTESIKNDYNGFIRALSQSLEAEEKHEILRGEQGPDDYHVRTISCAHLRRYVSLKHRLMGIFPFNKEVLAPLILRWGWEKVSAMLKERYFPEVPPSQSDEAILFSLERSFKITKAENFAYVHDADGDLKVFKGTPPLSLSYFVSQAWNFLYPASTDFGHLLRRSRAGLEFMNNTIDLHIPNFLLSENAFYVYDFLGIGFSAKCFDDSMSVRWAEYAVDKRKTLKIALTEYKRCIENPMVPKDELALAEGKVRELVEEGHRPRSWFPMSLSQQWRNFRQTGGSKISTVTGYWVAAMSAIKGISYGKRAIEWWYRK